MSVLYVKMENYKKIKKIKKRYGAISTCSSAMQVSFTFICRLGAVSQCSSAMQGPYHIHRQARGCLTMFICYVGAISHSPAGQGVSQCSSAMQGPHHIHLQARGCLIMHICYIGTVSHLFADQGLSSHNSNLLVRG